MSQSVRSRLLRNGVESPEASDHGPKQEKDTSQQQKVKNSRPSSFDPGQPAERSGPSLKRRPWITFLLLAPFLGSIIGAYAWFNTSLGLRTNGDRRPESADRNIRSASGLQSPVSDEAASAELSFGLRTPDSGLRTPVSVRPPSGWKPGRTSPPTPSSPNP